MKNLVVLLLVFVSWTKALAQFPPRVDDHFWRKKVFEKIDLREKLNENIVRIESKLYTKGKYGETNGMVTALLNGLRDSKFIGYRFDSLQSPMTYTDFLNAMAKIEGKAPVGGGGGTEGFEDEGDEEEFEEEEDDLGGGGETEQTTDGGGQDDVLKGGGKGGDNPYAANMEEVMGIIEDRIFDKNKSDMYYDLQYIVLFYSDPSGTLDEEPVISFSYKDVMDVLDDTQYKNRTNDAEYRSLREVFEFRLFKSFVVDLSGYKVLNLEESALRDRQMVEFEHHLWEF